MDSKIWRATGEYDKKKKTFVFTKELIADKKSHVKEKIYSDLGSRHRVKRREIRFEKIEEIEPEELTDLDLRRLLGVEAEF
ncbi:50S ribosomal protein L18a [Candidatus Thorarchaeota archaeon]|nr:MAG: 50S ribosomal protein L18a [Candidatus Thorarchaeota archaeon]